MNVSKEGYLPILKDDNMRVFGSKIFHIGPPHNKRIDIHVNNIVLDFYVLVIKNNTNQTFYNLIDPVPLIIWKSYIGNNKTFIHVVQAATGKPLPNLPLFISQQTTSNELSHISDQTGATGSYQAKNLIDPEDSRETDTNTIPGKYSLTVLFNHISVNDNLFEKVWQDDIRYQPLFDQHIKNNEKLMEADNRLKQAINLAGTITFPFSVQTEQQFYSNTKDKSILVKIIPNQDFT